MGVIIVPLRAEHVLSLRGKVTMHGQEIDASFAVDLEETNGFAVLDDESEIFGEFEVIAVGGIALRWNRVGTAWSLLSRKWRKYAKTITRIIHHHIEIAPLHRIELAVICENEKAHSWAKTLGFSLETERMRKWGPDGKDYAMYVRVK